MRGAEARTGFGVGMSPVLASAGWGLREAGARAGFEVGMSPVPALDGFDVEEGMSPVLAPGRLGVDGSRQTAPARSRPLAGDDLEQLWLP